MMIIPLPPWLLDLLLTANIAAALAIVLATLYTTEPLAVLGVPVAAAGDHALPPGAQRLRHPPDPARTATPARSSRRSANFVVGGNFVVGLVVFLILIVIQFVVITNGAGRVAEVAARFTLDAMPGKQMAIDADLNAGLITDEEATQAPRDPSPGRPTSTARWTAPRSSSRATRSPPSSSC